MRKNKTRLLPWILALMLCLTSCTGGSGRSGESEAVVLPEPASEAQNQILGDRAAETIRSVALYYPAESGTEFTAVTRSVSLQADDRLVDAALDALLGETGGESLGSDVSLIHTETACGIVTVDLGIEAAVRQNEQDYLQLCAAIANTLLDIKGVNAVNILIGDRSEALWALPAGCFTQRCDSIAAIAAQIQTESELLLGSGGGSAERSAALYFPSSDNRFLLPEIRNVRFTDGDFVTPVLDAMIEGPQERSCCFAVIPKTLDLLRSEPKTVVTDSGERMIEFDFSPMLPNYIVFSGLEPWQFYGSLVLSMCSFVPGIDALRILSDGKPVESCIIGSENRRFENGVFRRKDFSSMIGSSAAVWFTDLENRLCRSECALTQSAAQSPLGILTALITAVPKAGALFSVFPEGIETCDILGVSVEERIATVNLSGNFYVRCQSLDERQERNLLYAMINTLCEPEGIGAVRFLVEGLTVDSLAQSISLKTPLLPDPGLADQ